MTGRIVLAAGLLASLGGCVANAVVGGPGGPNSDPQLGSVVSRNIAVQAIDMNPVYAGVPIEGGSGQRSAAALKRYQTGQIKQLEKTSGKSEVGGQGGATSETGSATPK